MLVEILAQLSVHLHQEVFLANGNPIELRLRGKEACQLIVNLRGIAVHACCCRLQAVVVEGFGIEAGDAKRMAATHRESRHGTCRPFADGLVVAVDEVHDVHEALFHRCLCTTVVEGVAIWCVHALMPPARRSVARRIAVRHHHNHRHSLACSDEVVHDLRSAAKVAPSRLVATVAMQQIHHRELLLAVVGCRQINRHATLLAQRRTIVPNTRQRAMRNIVHLIQIALVALSFRHDEDIAQC